MVWYGTIDLFLQDGAPQCVDMIGPSVLVMMANETFVGLQPVTCTILR